MTPSDSLEAGPDGQSPLFKLSGELRNRIYRLLLLPEPGGVIDITAQGVEEPSILLSCHEVRNEAISIFYAENDFVIHVTDYDSSPLMEFGQHVRKREKQHSHFYGPMTAVCQTANITPNWANLLLWCQRNHRNEVTETDWFPSDAPAGSSQSRLIVGGMFQIVHEMSGLPWENVERLLKGQRRILFGIDKRWEAEGSGPG
ncbi:hypothetical protein LTR85_006811 [Meristemomyces frigidus]|nr:hypothetical protein LTR85_006811 [Meristemomyces frigidus]